MDEPTRLRMRRASSERSRRCVCGRDVFGNGKAHQRVCPDYLGRYGWPLDEAMAAAVRDHASTSDRVAFLFAVQRKLGAWVLARRETGDRTLPAWIECGAT